MICRIIREYEDEIISNWQASVSALGSDLSDITEALTIYRGLLQVVVDELEHQANAAGKDALRWPQRHASVCARDGLSLEFLLATYSTLRLSVTRACIRHSPVDLGNVLAFVRLHEIVDRIMGQAALEHARHYAAERDHCEAILAHDLRNPLAAVRFTIEAIARKSGDTSRTIRCLKSIDKMHRLIESLLQLTRLRKQHAAQLDLQSVDLSAVARESVAEAREAHPEARVCLQAPRELLGTWDREMLSQVLDNLLGNAIVYGDIRHGVTLTIAERGDWASIDVHNRGEAIAADSLGNLFDPFTRCKTVTQRPEGGLGLGLYIVKRAVSAHHGDVQVASSPGAGTCFKISLPRSQ